jgi:hypothetical protein
VLELVPDQASLRRLHSRNAWRGLFAFPEASHCRSG